jgi:hypothetical protein
MDIAANLTQDIIFLTLYISLIVFSSNDKKIHGFVRGLIIVGFSIRIILLIAGDVLSNAFKVWSYWEDELSLSLMNAGYIISYFILLYCITFFIGKTKSAQLHVNENVNVNIKKRRIWLSLLLFWITSGLYGPFWLYRTVKDLKSNFHEIPYTPGQAVGFLFIPVFNLYWMFRLIFTLPLYISRIEKKYYKPEYGFQFHPVLISILWVLLIIYSYAGPIAASTDNFSFLTSLSPILSSMFCIWIIVLTIQAKINSFADVPKIELRDQNVNDLLEKNPDVSVV